MLEHLFGSKTRLKLLRVFFRDQDKAFYVRELTRLIDAQINAVRRELELLVKAGLIKETASSYSEGEGGTGVGLRKYYRLAHDSLLYPELHALLIKAQVLGEREFSEEIKNKGGEIKLFVLSGAFTSDKRAPTDILIVGNLKERSVARLIEKYEKEFGFPIRYTLMSEREFFDRRQVMDKFLFALFEAEHVKVVNKLGL